MVFYATLIAALILFEYGLEALATILNLKNLSPEVPDEFRGVYDAEKYKTSLAYQREGSVFALIKNTFFTTVILIFIFGGGFAWVDAWAVSYSPRPIVQGLVFAAILTALRMLSSLPFSIYGTFRIEQKYGFNKTTPATFIGDLAKGIVIGGVIGGLIYAGLIYFFETTGPKAWLISWVAFTIFQLFFQFIAPVVILPLFNKFKPLPAGALKDAIDAYARKENFKLDGIFTMDASKRSTKSNAFFTGFGKFRRLVLFDTLIERQTVDELVAVVAHEVGHFKRQHIPKFTLISILSSGFLFFVLGQLMNNPDLFAAFGMSHVSTYASMILVSILLSPIMRFSSLFTNFISRKFEFEADEFSVETFRQPARLIDALKKLSVDSFSHLTPHRLRIAIDYTHPPVLQRIQVLRNLIRKTS